MRPAAMTTRPGAVATPEDLADKLLAKLDASTDVTVGPDVQVAGRAAYNLVLTPTSEVTLVDSVAIAVDGASGLPLGVEVKARGQAEPAFSVAFTSLTLETPDSAIFNFTPPPGATVKEIPLPDASRKGRRAAVGRRRGEGREAAHRHRNRLGIRAGVPRRSRSSSRPDPAADRGSGPRGRQPAAA